MYFYTTYTQEAIEKIENYIEQSGYDYEDWHVGITNDIDNRLFFRHSVSRRGVWIYDELPTDSDARTVEDYFLDMGCQGGPGGGDWRSKFIYAYKITPYTIEQTW